MKTHTLYPLAVHERFWKIFIMVPTPTKPQYAVLTTSNTEVGLVGDLGSTNSDSLGNNLDSRLLVYKEPLRRIARPKIDDKAHFELKGQFLKELCDNTFNRSDNEDANEHIEKVLEIVNLFHIPDVTQDQIMLRVFPMSLTRATSRWLRNKPSGLIITWETLKKKCLSKYCPPA
ncbi:hypothetical protein Tco_1155073 [Tanacetum coccineum]